MTRMMTATSTIDLKDRIKALEELIETISRGKLQWESTFDVISDPVVIIDENYIIARANRGLASACGQDVRKVIGKKCYEVFAGYKRPCPGCPVAETLKEKKPCEAELDPFPLNKRQYHANVYNLPFREKGKQEVVLHYRDVTDERELQRQLMQADKMAAVGTLAGGIAHEINNPLGAILAHVQLASSELDKLHPTQEFLKEIQDAVLRCKKIVRDLLDFSRQNFDEQMEILNLNQVIRKTMDLIGVNFKQAQIQVEEDFQKNLPQVYGHFHKLLQMAINLVTNAIQAMRATGGTLKLKTYVNERGQICFEVKDTGTGISPEHMNKIFNPFFTTKEQGEGTGLGLSICYKIVQEHGGKIEVENHPEGGTCFLISLPCYKEKKS